MTQIYLASQSPRRRELLQQIGVTFDIINASIDETPFNGESPEQLVVRLATEKARAGLAQVSDESAVVIGSDTIVVSPQGEIFGKPQNFADAQRMLNALSNNTHSVMTALAVVTRQQVWSQNVITKVSFCHLSADMIAAYWQTGEPHDKAGAYGIQGFAGQYVNHLQGSYSAVVGLPLYETRQLLDLAIDSVN
ncbi:hypothetical protein C2869_21435 [Saccharobesus litoralis]|uniref:dTTP/UTP pyrophosphatase n=1 Tax=Saccharobesus litoralis TaxID=2172099 RepID=A0A2S0VX81_9ALTE|nr:Maf family protein [Saccharobesus litoralis]AWB68803.1 hypothetical protein C2869_21435 [Saccharobesus litoralis]